MTQAITKEQWVELFEAAGLDHATMAHWHALFEQRYPAGHQAFMEWLGIPAGDIETIRARSRA